MNFSTQKKGFVLLYAVLTGSLLLLISTAIFSLSVKQLNLSSVSRDSQFALYASDSGAECALYNDYHNNSFSTSSTASITCNGQTITGMGGQGYGVASTFSLAFTPYEYCVTVNVTKSLNASGEVATVIDSHGFSSCNTTNRNRTERVLRVDY